jgi:hypothetical protein
MMSVRRSYHFNTNSSDRRDGLFYGSTTDHHFRGTGYSDIPYGIDRSGNNYLDIGDYSGYKSNSSSLPIRIAGGFGHRIRILSASGNATVDDGVVLMDTSAATLSLTLPQASSVPFAVLYIENIGANPAQILASGSDTIDGETQKDLHYRENDSVMIVADALNNTWRVISSKPKVFQLINNFAPIASTTSSSYSTLYTSSSYRFSGHPLIMFFSGSFRDSNASAEFYAAEFAFRFDSGTDYIIARGAGNINYNHQAVSGHILITPSAGTHTVSLRWRRASGSGTMDIDTNDFLQLHSMQVG